MSVKTTTKDLRNTPSRPVPEKPPKPVDTKANSSRFSICRLCNGFGGMDGGCPRCGGTGFSDNK